MVENKKSMFFILKEPQVNDNCQAPLAQLRSAQLSSAQARSGDLGAIHPNPDLLS